MSHPTTQPQTLDEVIDRHIAAKAMLDFEALATGFADNFEQESVGELHGVVSTHDGLWQSYQAMFGALVDPVLRTIRRYHGNGFVIDETEVTATVNGALLGISGQGQRISFRLLHVFEIDRNEIIREQGWADACAVARQLCGTRQKGLLAGVADIEMRRPLRQKVG